MIKNLKMSATNCFSRIGFCNALKKTVLGGSMTNTEIKTEQDLKKNRSKKLEQESALLRQEYSMKTDESAASSEVNNTIQTN